MTSPIIMPNTKLYNQLFHGVFGEFGQGGGAQIFFIQTAISSQDLKKISLVGEIEGSEKWEVRDLFQRDVNIERVSGGLVPYLLDTAAIKFFNPLTLTFIPTVAESNAFGGSIPVMNTYPEKIDEYPWNCIENESFYRFRHVDQASHAGVVEWNDSNAKLVAIDGQHRLSALKHVLNDPLGHKKIDFDNWKIPVVIFGVRSIQDEALESQRTLDVVRRTFVYINTEAKAPSETRQILLNDSKVNEICTQEFVNYFHANDCLSEKDRDISKLPLLIFNWRGAQEGDRSELLPANLHTIAEVRDWFQHYLLGENWGPDQQILLSIEPVGETFELKEAFANGSLKPKLVKQLRKLFNTNVLPGVSHVLQEFEPIKMYSGQLRKIEAKYNKDSDVARHAFDKFRFGTSKASDDLREKVDDLQLHINVEIDQAKNVIPDILKRDIGMRCVFFAYGDIFKQLSKYLDHDSFNSYSIWFVAKLNEVFMDGWFGPFAPSSRAHSNASKTRSLLRQIAYSHTDTIINYRLVDSRSALGGLIAMIISSKAAAEGSLDDNFFNKYYSDHRDRLSATLLRGYKKEVRPQVIEDLPADASTKKINDVIKKHAEKKTSAHLDKLDKYLLGN